MFVEAKFFHKAGEGSGGGGGGDSHNLGYYADLTALQTAHPTGTDGDFAILGSTDTIWVWDSGTSAWKDTDTKGQVTSVNGQTGAVTVDTLPSQTGHSGEFLTTDGTDASWAAISALQNTATGSDGLTIAGTASTYQRATNVGVSSSAKTSGTAFGRGASAGDYAVALGQGSVASNDAVAVGFLAKAQGGSSIAIVADSFGTAQPTTGSGAIAIGQIASAQANFAIQLGNGINSTAYTFSVGYGINNNYRMLDSDGTIPADRLPNAINKYSTMPTAASTNVGWIVQYTGATDSTYTHGYIYECKAQGTNPETYAWEAVEVQAGGGGGGGATATTATLAVNDWSSNTQTVNVTGVTSSSVIILQAAPASQADYTRNNVYCSAQGSGTLTFTCVTTPLNAITVNVIIM